MIDTTHQSDIRHWLCTRIGLVPTSHFVAIGARRHGRLVGAVGYDQFNGASIMMHAAGEPGWLTREFLGAVFDYPFRTCKANMVIGLVPSGNMDALRFNQHLGFKTECVLEGAHPDGALVLMTMPREGCRFLNRSRYGHAERLASVG